MEAKTVILCVFIQSLVMAQILVEAEVCCPDTTARDVYKACHISDRFSDSTCARISNCKIVDECPPGYQNDILRNSGDVINKYCKLGCATSVCGAITTLQNSDAGKEEVNGAVERCTKACSAFCTKGSITALETA